MCGAEEVLQSAAYTLLLANYYQSPERQRAHLATLRDEAVAGSIFAASSAPGNGYRDLLEAGVPMTAISRVPDDVPVDTMRVANERVRERSAST